ncbi:hypothetical protein A8926_5963 [Saccharopolyspora spinosa]|uniref:Uncharacterized protein n=1 Tax=Saccharopolyspora spinosa TaxID=60894 RepID=A0A2N3Y520_SACSN|nr:hypothetical protein A8926_5963 [Saccharopolyspora spinosa]
MGAGQIAATDETLTIEPPSPSAIRVPISAASRNGPEVTASTLSHNASLTWSRLG